MNIDIASVVRKNILELKPYSSARSEFNGEASILLDANENSFGSPLEKNYNRYPDPMQTALKTKLASMKKVERANICVGNGSDEIIDYIIKVFCEPRKDNIITTPPTFRMYSVAASIHEVAVRQVFLIESFQLDVPSVLNAIDEKTKVIFLCSPNNPTGNLMRRDDIESILDQFNGIVVIDEAYLDFSKEDSFIRELPKHNNLIVLQTFSKDWGLAGLRIGTAYSDPAIIAFLNKVKTPYNVSSVTQQMVLQALENGSWVDQKIEEVIAERNSLTEKLKEFSFVEKVYYSDTNFLLARVTDAQKLYNYLLTYGIVVRNQSSQPQLNNCLRITVGTPEQNILLIKALKNYSA